MSTHEAGGPAVDEALIQLLTGAWATRAVATAARLGIPEMLASGPMTAEEVAGKGGFDAGATYRLLRALASLSSIAAGGGAVMPPALHTQRIPIIKPVLSPSHFKLQLF